MTEYKRKTINMVLAEERGISKEAVGKIIDLHAKRQRIEDQMAELDPGKERSKLRTLLVLWRENEFELQDLWGFPRDATHHRDFLLPHCSCPVMDNEERVGTGHRIYSEGCVYHGHNRF